MKLNDNDTGCNCRHEGKLNFRKWIKIDGVDVWKPDIRSQIKSDSYMHNVDGTCCTGKRCHFQ